MWGVKKCWGQKCSKMFVVKFVGGAERNGGHVLLESDDPLWRTRYYHQSDDELDHNAKNELRQSNHHIDEVDTIRLMKIISTVE